MLLKRLLRAHLPLDAGAGVAVPHHRRRAVEHPLRDAPRHRHAGHRWSRRCSSGSAQALAIIPAISRSGATIAAGALERARGGSRGRVLLPDVDHRDRRLGAAGGPAHSAGSQRLRSACCSPRSSPRRSRDRSRSACWSDCCGTGSSISSPPTARWSGVHLPGVVRLARQVTQATVRWRDALRIDPGRGASAGRGRRTAWTGGRGPGADRGAGHPAAAHWVSGRGRALAQRGLPARRRAPRSKWSGSGSGSSLAGLLDERWLTRRTGSPSSGPTISTSTTGRPAGSWSRPAGRETRWAGWWSASGSMSETSCPAGARSARHAARRLRGEPTPAESWRLAGGRRGERGRPHRRAARCRRRSRAFEARDWLRGRAVTLPAPRGSPRASPTTGRLLDPHARTGRDRGVGSVRARRDDGMSGRRALGYRLLGRGFDYLLHLRPAEWPIMAVHLLTGSALAIGLAGMLAGRGRAGAAGSARSAFVIGINGGTLALNSAFDRDEGDVAYLQAASAAAPGLALFGLALMVAGAARRRSGCPGRFSWPTATLRGAVGALLGAAGPAQGGAGIRLADQHGGVRVAHSLCGMGADRTGSRGAGTDCADLVRVPVRRALSAHPALPARGGHPPGRPYPGRCARDRPEPRLALAWRRSRSSGLPRRALASGWRGGGAAARWAAP